MLVQELTPAVPDIAKVITPFGAAAPVVPVTVAVKITEPPRVGALEDVNTTLGVAVTTVVEPADATAATALYALSPGKVKVAPYVPAKEATTVQVYVEILELTTGPVDVAQLVTPLTPVILQVPRAVGAVAETGPVTVAVKVMLEPSEALVVPATTPTVGVALLTVVVLPEVGAVAR